ncbi:MAG: carboxypeptidase-like regulatory domain-containing protein, partial [Terracidiphilus sp.]
MAYRICRYLCLSLMMLIGITYAWADVTGSVSGYVRDSSGAVIPNASVNATQVSTGYTRTTNSDSVGHYTLLALPPGVYRLTATATGFDLGAIEQINLNVNDALAFDFALKVGNVSTTVSVSASSLQVDTVSTSLGSTISTNQILVMPLNGRSYLDLLSLQPGVAPASSNGNYTDRAPASGLYGSAGT